MASHSRTGPATPTIHLAQRLGALFTAPAPILGYLLLIRAPLLGALVMILLPLGAMGSLSALFLGAYDLSERWDGGLDGFLFGFVLNMVVGCLRAQRHIVDQHGAERFGAQAVAPASGFDSIWEFLLFVAIALNVVATLIASESARYSSILVGLAAGLAIAALINRLFFKPIQDASSSQKCWIIPWLAKLFPNGIPGVLKTQGTEGNKSSLYSSHFYALIQAVILILLLATSSSQLPPAASVLILVALCSQIVGFVAFLGDAYRIPIFLLAAIWFTLMTLWRESDHYYRIWPRPEKVELPTPADLLSQAIDSGTKTQVQPIFIIAAEGGGIQSAAWTAAAMKEIAAVSGLGDRFHSYVKLISGVSGGSVGALHYALAVSDTNSHSDRFEKAAQIAGTSSLRRATGGLVRWDLPRALVPIAFSLSSGLLKDRANALEDGWIEISDAIHGENGPRLRDATLYGWGALAAQGKMPAVLFNSTIVETGERMAFCTAPRRRVVPIVEAASKRNQPRFIGNVEFAHRYNADLRMVTAARLSATFPVVSPAARPALAESADAPPRILPGREYWDTFPQGGSLHHCVDGGYYENKGIVGALEWLEDGLQDLRSRNQFPLIAVDDVPNSHLLQIVFIELSAFPDPAPSEVVDLSARPAGALFDLSAPLQTLVNVRSSGQRAFASLMVEEFKAAWKDVAKISHVRIVPDPKNLQAASTDAATDPSSEADKKSLFHWTRAASLTSPPLSWHLRQQEFAMIADQVHLVVNQIKDKGFEEVRVPEVKTELVALNDPQSSPSLQNRVTFSTVRNRYEGGFARDDRQFEATMTAQVDSPPLVSQSVPAEPEKVKDVFERMKNLIPEDKKR